MIKSNLVNEYTYISSGVMGVFTLLDTETDIETEENGLKRIVWMCSYCAVTDINTDSH